MVIGDILASDLNMYFMETDDEYSFLSIGVGTNCPCGGDAGHGGRTKLMISDQGGTCWEFRIIEENGKEHIFENPHSIELLLKGDSEWRSITRILDFAVSKLRKK